MPVHTFTLGWTAGNGSLSRSARLTAGASLEISEIIPGDTDQPVIFGLDVSQLKGLYMLITSAPSPAAALTPAAATLATNSQGSPANIFTLLPDVPFLWIPSNGPLRDTAGALVTVDITRIYVEPADEQDALFELRALYDPTV